MGALNNKEGSVIVGMVQAGSYEETRCLNNIYQWNYLQYFGAGIFQIREINNFIKVPTVHSLFKVNIELCSSILAPQAPYDYLLCLGE